MYHCHALSNTKSFKKLGEDYLCRSCNQFVGRTWCGVRKIMEYNRETETLTIWHQGKHRCQVRPGHKTVEQKQKGKEMLVQVSCISKTACFLVNCTPLSLQFGWNEEPKGSNGSHLSECDYQTPPSKLDTAPFWRTKPQPIRGFPAIEPMTFRRRQ